MAFLGLDTSNYTSSAALAENGSIFADKRKLLEVKAGGLGLRQSDALFQHWTNMPLLLKEVFEYVHNNDVNLEGIVVSTRPRPQEGSYMPVFNAGNSIAEIIAASNNIPVIKLSHQEGHILAATYGNDVDFTKPLVCAHLSGGTLELVSVNDGKIDIIGGTKDISYGQLIDRAGVLLGMHFPAGKEIDALATKNDIKGLKSPFKAVKADGTYLNLSGLETQMKKAVSNDDLASGQIAAFLMKEIAASFVKIIDNTGIKQVLVTGGVASSSFLREYCDSYKYMFGRKELCSDNACGLALSEGTLPWLKQ